MNTTVPTDRPLEPEEVIDARVNDLLMRFNVRAQNLARESMRRDNLKTLVDATAAEVTDYSKAIELCKACLDAQVDAKSYIEKIATALLNTVFQGVHAENPAAFGGEGCPTYEFVFDIETDAEGAVKGFAPMIIKNGVKDAPSEHGGGEQTLSAMAIRMVYLLLNPNLSPILILDEPMTNLSKLAWEYFGRFVADLQIDLPLQLIAITHSGASFPTTYEVTRRGQMSVVTKQG